MNKNSAMFLLSLPWDNYGRAQRVRYVGTKDFWIVASGFMAAMHIGKLPPIVPILCAELGISLVQAGFLLCLVKASGMTLACC